MSPRDAYTAASERVAFLAHPGRSVLEVTGPRALRVIDGLASNTIEGVTRGAGVYSFLLEPRGRVVVDLRVLPRPGFEEEAVEGEGEAASLWFDYPSEGTEALLAHLSKYVPPIFAECRPVDVSVFSFLGPRAADCVDRLLAAAGSEASRPPDELEPLEAATVKGEGLPDPALLVRREEIEVAGLDLYVGPAVGPALADGMARAVEAAGGVPAHSSDWDVLRVERGLPVYGRELSADRLAQEAGQDARAISFTKGCFTGQEVVARIHYRGHVNRHLRGIRPAPESGEDELPRAGAALERDGRTVGTVTSTTSSPRFGRIGLAYLRREIDPGDRVTSPALPGIELEAIQLPFTST